MGSKNQFIAGKKRHRTAAGEGGSENASTQPGPITNYLQNVYYATADVYRVLGNSDSFYHYSQLYNNLHDSIERAVANSRLEIARLRLDNQSNVSEIRDLQKEKDAETQERNYIIVAIFCCH